MALARERIVDAALPGPIIGVLSTGIYCVPTCRARKPKPENVRYFRTTEEARAAGLRPCKICKPDEFERGVDPDLDRLEEVAEAVRATPGRFECVEAIAELACTSPSTLHVQFRQHFQIAPGTFLSRARINASQRLLLESDMDAAEVGVEVGFESTSGFYDGFRRVTGMSPAAFRGLAKPGTTQFRLLLPEGYPVGELLKVLARDPDSSSERLSGKSYAIAYSVERRPNLLTMRFSGSEVDCKLEGEDTGLAHSIATRVLNLRQDPTGFERQMSEVGFERLFEGRQGMRISQTPTVFEGLVWVIVGQQVNFKFAAALRRRVHELVGVRHGDLYCIPEASDVAGIDEADLPKMQFSRQKAEYLLHAARSADRGELALEEMQARSATSAEKRLLSVRGIGVWSANYLMMRSLGFMDCVPAGDTGISSGLVRFLGLEKRPSADEVVDLMRQFAPHRSLACYHLWKGFSA